LGKLGKRYMGSVCIISYNCIWICNYSKINNSIVKQGRVDLYNVKKIQTKNLNSKRNQSLLIKKFRGARFISDIGFLYLNTSKLTLENIQVKSIMSLLLWLSGSAALVLRLLFMCLIKPFWVNIGYSSHWRKRIC
jgi:hypothetical protein